jgi:DNA-directed RNA polymerase specialized sigma24 family protein
MLDVMGVRTRTWTVTSEAFDMLLAALDGDRDRAGRQYEVMRRRLLEFFEARGSHTPEEHVDETFDRVMRRITEGERIVNFGNYCYGVARFVWIEAARSFAKQPGELDERIVADRQPDNDLIDARLETEQKLDCLEECLDQLAETTRNFIVEYYREENGVKIEQRKLLASRLNTTLNALRLRASRLRRELGKCTDACVSRSTGPGEKA